MNIKMNQNGFAPILIMILVALGVLVVGGGGYFFVKNRAAVTIAPTPMPESNPPAENTVTPPASPSVNANPSKEGNCSIREGDIDKSAMARVNDPPGPGVWELNSVRIKFKEGTDVRLRNGQFASLCGADLSLINRFIFVTNRFAAMRGITISEEQAEEMYQTAFANDPRVKDANLGYQLTLNGNASIAKLQQILDALNAFDLIEYALPHQKPPPLPAP